MYPDIDATRKIGIEVIYETAVDFGLIRQIFTAAAFSHGMSETLFRNLAVFICVSWVCGSSLLRAQQPPPNGKPLDGPGQSGLHPGPGGPPPPPPLSEAKTIPQPKNDRELAGAIKKLADTLASSGRFSGSILVAADGKTLVDGAWSEADREQRTANTAATAYDVGSIGKIFTQIAILQLLEAGKLSLDQPFGKYLANYPDSDIAGKVTIRQLLLHASGMGDIFDQGGPVDLGSVTELKGFLPLIAHKPLAFEPGSAKRYSNAGYVVLGMVVEAVSEENYYSYIQAHILEPAGMSRSGFFDRKHLPAFVAHSYDDSKDVTGTHAQRGSPAGGLQASAGDLFRLVQTINDGKLISKESVKLLREMVPHPPNALPPSDETKLIAYGIAGGAPGVSALLGVDPSGRYTRVVLSNAGPPMAMSMGAAIGEWIKQMPK